MNLFEEQAKLDQQLRRHNDPDPVYAKHTNDNRKFVAEFYGPCEDLVRKRAQQYYDACDSYSSPSLRPVTFDGTMYHCTVIYWSMD